MRFKQERVIWGNTDHSRDLEMLMNSKLDMSLSYGFVEIKNGYDAEFCMQRPHIMSKKHWSASFAWIASGILNSVIGTAIAKYVKNT